MREGGLLASFCPFFPPFPPFSPFFPLFYLFYPFIADFSWTPPSKAHCGGAEGVTSVEGVVLWGFLGVQKASCTNRSWRWILGEPPICFQFKAVFSPRGKKSLKGTKSASRTTSQGWVFSENPPCSKGQEATASAQCFHMKKKKKMKIRVLNLLKHHTHTQRISKEKSVLPILM